MAAKTNHSVANALHAADVQMKSKWLPEPWAQAFKSNSSKKPKDIFDTFHRGKDKKDGAGKKAHAAEKPFGSSYY